MKKGYITALGYLLILAGFMSILLSMVGLQLTFLGWLSDLSVGFSILVKLVMLFSGLIIMYMSKMPPEDDADIIV
jgi:hypothetical protein